MDRNSLPSSGSGVNSMASHGHGHAASAVYGTRAGAQRSDESWVEVSSRPSSSSLSSAADEIITDGLRVQHDSNLLRRRMRRRQHPQSQPGNDNSGVRQTQGGSSQEEYEESESESDRVMTSSNEQMHPSPSPLQHEWRPHGFTLSSTSSENEHEHAYGSSEDENATAINQPRGEHCFTPQPNAFSHPPTAISSNRPSNPQQSMNSYFAQRPSRPTPRTSMSGREQHSPYGVVSPSQHADHDAALRASLSTLLSAAAAVRGLPKPSKPATESRARVASNRVDPMSIGLMPESAIYGTSSPRATAQTSSRPTTTNTTNADKSKRKEPAQPTTAQRSNSKDRRASKKARTKSSTNWTPATMEEVNPTLLTWFVGAGVVVLVSALSFSAGYITGREAGRAEVLELYGSSEARNCGKEAIAGAGRGLRRIQWTDAASSMVA